jgi:hypothetical protein
MGSRGRDARAYAKALSWTGALAGALLWTPTAAAASPPPPPEDVPAVSAYVELVPTSRGSRSTAAGAAKRRSLPREVETRLARQGGRDAPLLKEVATSPAYGAPTGRVRERKQTKLPAEPRDETTLGSAVSVATDGSDDRLLGLGFVLLALTVAAGVAAYLRRGTA